MINPMITAHSGCEGTGIDTMESIEKALTFNADAVEIDIRMDPFGVLRISHDPLSIEDYFKKNPLSDVFDRILPTSMMINFDIKEQAALYKTINAAHEFGFPTERLIFTGCTTPELLIKDPELAHKAKFFLNLERVVKYVVSHRKGEFSLDIFNILMEDPFLLFIDRKSSIISDNYLSKASRIQQKLYEISKTLMGKILEDTVRIYQETHAAAANLSKILLWTSFDDDLKANNIQLSFWTVNEADFVHRCLEIGAYNITTRNIQLTRRIVSQNKMASTSEHLA